MLACNYASKRQACPEALRVNGDLTNPTADATAVMATHALLDAAAQYIWSDSFQHANDAFVAEHAPAFAGASSGGEQDLRWHAIYRLYADLYESRLEDFLASHGCDLDEFVAACRDALAHSTWQEHRGLATCILSMAEYDYFITMMADAAEDAANPVDYTDVRRAPVVLCDDDDAPPSQPGDELDGEFM